MMGRVWHTKPQIFGVRYPRQREQPKQRPQDRCRFGSSEREVCTVRRLELLSRERGREVPGEASWAPLQVMVRPLYLFIVLKTEIQNIAEAGQVLALKPRLVLNSGSSFLCLLNAGITNMYHHGKSLLILLNEKEAVQEFLSRKKTRSL
jgi:hypothetical protein